MHSRLGSICDSLTRQLDCYKTLIGLSEKERVCLRQKDSVGLARALNEKEAVLCIIKELEAQRKGQVRSLAAEANLSEESLTVTQMMELATEPYRSRLQQIKREIHEVSAALAAATQRNIFLVEHLQGYARDMIGLFLAFNQQGTVYRRNGGIESCRKSMNTTIR